MNILFKLIYILINLLWLFLECLYYIGETILYCLCGRHKKCVAGEIVLITGAGHGIGKELAIQYAQLGATVVCLDRDGESNKKTKEEIQDTTKKTVHAYQCDVSKKEEVSKVAAKIQEEVGDVTILINNAGIMSCHKFLDYTSKAIKDLFDINIIAHIWTLQAFLPKMIEKNKGHIVAISSIAGLAGIPYLVPYSATKQAVRGLMETLKDELRISAEEKSLIKFTTIFPYIVDTGLCKNPKLNNMLLNLMAISSTKYVAKQIINAQRQNISELSIPAFWTLCISIAKLLPDKAQESIRDFFDSGVEPEPKDDSKEKKVSKDDNSA